MSTLNIRQDALVLRRRPLLLGALAALGATSIGAAAPAFAQSSSPGSPLEGRRFEGVFLERGKTRGDADTLTFKDGRFRSSACDRYGYGDAPYRATAAGDTVTFEAETESPKYGKLIWRGTVRGDKLDATVLAPREGKAPVENWVVAGAVK
ncbi:MAG: hypothetical protein IPM15_03190 [Betaproteobacteria bacterium]|nr:hypothetical protein [Betaproteobacteria bacterium]MCC6249942.1 hypothetical protein [Rubrivivax sp.]MCL4695524.1 hypothetical protein [Burkholderiaceae bacterium]